MKVANSPSFEDDRTLVPAITAAVFGTRADDWLVDNAAAAPMR